MVPKLFFMSIVVGKFYIFPLDQFYIFTVFQFYIWLSIWLFLLMLLFSTGLVDI